MAQGLQGALLPVRIQIITEIIEALL